MHETYSDDFLKSLKKFASIKKRIRNKIDRLINDPLMGEPLKYDLRGLYSVPVANHFILIYAYCDMCRRKGDDRILCCHDCDSIADETMRFFDIGPHDAVYKKLIK